MTTPIDPMAAVKVLREKMQQIIEGVPAVDASGQFFTEYHGLDGEYQGAQYHDPCAIIQSMVGVAHDALAATAHVEAPTSEPVAQACDYLRTHGTACNKCSQVHGESALAGGVATPITQDMLDRASVAIRDVVGERQRQIKKEGWHENHDDEHDGGDLARAAACYAYPLASPLILWPFSEPIKLKDDRRNYVRAAALLLAEIERMDRAADRAATTNKPNTNTGGSQS
jgi:hypothetical protein